MMKKIMLRVMPIVLVALMLVFADVNKLDKVEQSANGTGVTVVENAVSKIWSTVLLILQICAVAAIVFAGVKYMFASADQKADIKSGMIGLVVGAILVFAASTIVKFIISATEQVA